MNKIETLIKERCPNGVEWCELWEETVWDKKFNSVENYKQAEVDKYRYLLASDATKIIQEVGEIKILTTNKSDIYTTNEFVEEFYDEEIIAIPWGGNPIVQYYKGKFVTADNRIARVKDKNRLNTKFLYYYLTNNLTLISTFYRGSGIKHPNMLKVLSIKIPVPPLEIQEEIVKILDKFTDYVTELTTELTLRQKQYNYYRDKLLSFENQCYKVVWRNLGDVATFNYGYTAKASESGEVRFIRITDINENGYLKVSDQKYIQSFTDVEKYFVKKGDLLMARTGATYGKTVYYDSDDNAVYASFLIKISPNPELNSRYYWHFSKSNLYWNQADKLVSKAGQPQFNANSLKNIKIPIPSLEIQSRIVQVLDNFDAVCNDLNIGLPKEIELRQKQYEFFRDKLLTFAAEGVYTDSTDKT